MAPASASALLAVVLFGLSASARAGGPEVLRVGHWAELKGRLDAGGTLVVGEVALGPEQRYEVLVGEVPPGERSWERFRLLGQPVDGDRLERAELPASAPAGLRLKVEGRYRGPRKFSARSVAERGKGRDLVEGRVDAIERVEGGFRVRVMSVVAFVADDVDVELAAPLAELQLVPPRGKPGIPGQGGVNEDDEIPETLHLAPGLYLGGQVEWQTTSEDEHDLDERDAQDRVDHEAALRLRLRWEVSDAVDAVATWRRRQLWRHDDEDGRVERADGRLGETWVRWNDAFGVPLELSVGRQDFDDRREWLYDQDLDALRLAWRPRPYALDLSVSTVLADGSRRDEDYVNWIAYLSREDGGRHLAAYVVDRRDGSAADDSPIFFGARALGEWLPDSESWLDLGLVKGFRGDVDLDGFGFDVGSTWSPDWLGPFDVTAGWAFGSGDDPATTEQNEAFVQTGLQDNNDRWGGVTSFRYYGELLDPELSNLSVATLGVGVRLARRTSLDLVWHAYRQDVAADRLRDSALDERPSGADRELGTELDLILGCRELASFDVELVGAWFRPGAAFPGGDDAFLVKLQLRYKF